MPKRKKAKSGKTFKNRKQTSKRTAPVKKTKQRSPGWLNKMYETPMHEEWNGHLENERYPAGFRDNYSSQMPRIPQYYHEEPFASAVIDRYAPLLNYPHNKKQNSADTKSKKNNSQKQSSKTVPLNEYDGLLRYRDSMDAQRSLTMRDKLTNTEWEEAYDAGVLHPEFHSAGHGGFSRFGRYSEGRDEMKEAYGSGSREGQGWFRRVGRHNKRKRK